MRHPFLAALVVAALAACKPQDPATLCTTYFEPYPDLVSERVRTEENTRFIDAMVAYRAGDYATAVTGLEDYLRRPTNDASVRIYLCCAYLATGDPGKAELQLDHIQNTHITGFDDHVDWYNALCLLCGGQLDRAKAQAEYIAAQPAHAFKGKAKELAASLGSR